MTWFSKDRIRSTDELKAEGTFETQGTSDLRGNVTFLQEFTVFNSSSTDDVMTLDPSNDAENGTIEIDVGGTVRQIPYWDK